MAIITTNYDNPLLKMLINSFNCVRNVERRAILADKLKHEVLIEQYQYTEPQAQLYIDEAQQLSMEPTL